MNKNEAFSRVVIDALLAAQSWQTTDPNAVRFEVVMPDGTFDALLAQTFAQA